MIDGKTVQKVAKLSRLAVTNEEAVNIALQMNSVLKAFELLARVSTENITPMITPTEILIGARDDDRVERYSVEEMVGQAPERSGDLFRVPPVVS